jgi:hypothetical protein
MKILFFILVTTLANAATAQLIDSLKQRRALPDSMIRSSIIPNARYIFSSNLSNTINNQGLSKASERKVQLYWDPVYLKFVPFPIHPNAKETWFTNAATIAAQALFPYKKVER